MCTQRQIRHPCYLDKVENVSFVLGTKNYIMLRRLREGRAGDALSPLSASTFWWRMNISVQFDSLDIGTLFYDRNEDRLYIKIEVLQTISGNLAVNAVCIKDLSGDEDHEGYWASYSETATVWLVEKQDVIKLINGEKV